MKPTKSQRKVLSKTIEGVGIAFVLFLVIIMVFMVYVNYKNKDIIAFFNFDMPTDQDFQDRTGKYTGEFHIRADPSYELRGNSNYALVLDNVSWLNVYGLLDYYPKEGAVELLFKPSGNFSSNQTLFEKISIPLPFFSS